MKSAARRQWLARVLCLMAMLPGILPRGAQAGTWEAMGPEAGLVRAFGFVPGSSTVYGVVRGGGVYKSGDGGASWNAASEGITRWSLTSVAAVDTDHVVVGSESGVFRSADGGAHWNVSGLAGRRVNILVARPDDRETLFAGTDAGLYRSTDGGGTWASFGGLAGDVRSLVFHPTNSGTLFAGLYDGAAYVYKSSDGGASWSASGTGIMAPVTTLFIDPAAPATIYAGTPAFLHKSSDGGASWSPLMGAMPGLGSTGIGKVPGGTRLMAGGLGGVYGSTDGGMSWNLVGAIPSQETAAIAVDPDGTAVYVGGALGPYRSSDGISWALSNPGLRAANTRVLMADDDPDTLYAATDHAGLMRTTDGGISWTRVDDGTLHGTLALARDPADPDVFYAGLQGDDAAGLKSEDGGVSWTPFGFAYMFVDWLRFVGNALYAGYSTGMDFAFSQSANGAANWQGLYTGRQFLDVITLDDGTLLAATEHGVMRRSAAGNWSSVTSGISGVPSALGQDAGGALYAATATTAYRSTDAGSSWSEDGNGFASGSVLAADYPNRSIYLGADGVYRRRSGTWSALPAGALGNRKVQHLVVRAPADYDVTLYAAAEEGGVFRYRVDTTPEPLLFASRTDVAKASAIESEALTVTGVEIPVAVRVTGGEFSINGGPFGTAPAWIDEGDALQLRVESAATERTETGMVAQVGASTFRFSVTTAIDPPPAPPADVPSDELPAEPPADLPPAEETLPPEEPPPTEEALPPDELPPAEETLPPEELPPADLPDEPPADDASSRTRRRGGGGASVWLLPLLAGAALIRRRGTTCV